MIKSWFEKLTIAAVLPALFAFAAPQQVLAGTLTVSAPKETGSIRLGVKDPPANAKLKGWYCVPIRGPLGVKKQSDVLQKKMADLMISTLVNELEEIVIMAVDQKNLIKKTNWPFNIAEKDKRVPNLDAPPGGKKVYKYRCYTKAELLKIQKTALTWLNAIWDPDATGELAAFKALSDWTGIH